MFIAGLGAWEAEGTGSDVAGADPRIPRGLGGGGTKGASTSLSDFSRPRTSAIYLSGSVSTPSERESCIIDECQKTKLISDIHNHLPKAVIRPSESCSDLRAWHLARTFDPSQHNTQSHSCCSSDASESLREFVYEIRHLHPVWYPKQHQDCKKLPKKTNLRSDLCRYLLLWCETVKDLNFIVRCFFLVEILDSKFDHGLPIIRILQLDAISFTTPNRCVE